MIYFFLGIDVGQLLEGCDSRCGGCVIRGGVHRAAVRRQRIHSGGLFGEIHSGDSGICPYSESGPYTCFTNL